MNRKIKNNIKKIVTHDKLNYYLNHTGEIVSINPIKRNFYLLLGLFLFSIGILLAGIGINLLGTNESEEISTLVVNIFKTSSDISQYTVTFVCWSVGIFWILGLIALFPKKNIAHILICGHLYIFWADISMFVAVVPTIFAATLESLGKISFIVQLIVAVYLVVTEIMSLFSKFKGEIYNKTKKVYSKYRGYFFLVSVIFCLFNQYLFKLGVVEVPDNKMFLIYGWAILAWAILLVVFIHFSTERMVISYYFLKYNQYFRHEFGFTDEEWYGKLKAKRIQRKCNRERRNRDE